MKLTRKNLVAQLITFVTLGLFAWYALANLETFEGLKNVSLFALLIIALARLAVFINNGYFIKWTTEAFTKQLTTGESLYIGMLSAIGNFFGPILGGVGVRAVYLKKVYGLPLSKFTSTLLSYYIILFSSVCLAAILSLLALGQTQSVLMLFFVAWLGVMLVVVFGRLPNEAKIKGLFKKGLANRLVNFLYEIEKGWQLLIKNHRLTRRLIMLAILSFITQLFITFVEFRAINTELSLAALSLYTALVVVSLLISFTPGAIGIREAILILAGSIIGITNEQILQVAVIDRGVTFGLLFVLFLLTRSKKVKKALTPDELPL